MSMIWNEISKQFEVIKCVPAIALYYWPAWFTFPAIEFVEAQLIAAFPNPGGMAGTLVNTGLRGMTRVVQMATWDAVKSQGVSGCGLTQKSGSVMA
jgi:hypothetical protein